MITVHDVAQYFCSLVDLDAGDSLSNLKLQKLLYYAQGFHLAMHDRPLFFEPIEAWEHGPVVPDEYRKLKKFGADPVVLELPDLSQFMDDEKELLNDVYETYGQFSASKLRQLSHQEPPWKNTRMGGVISRDVMRDYFKTQLETSKSF